VVVLHFFSDEVRIRHSAWPVHPLSRREQEIIEIQDKKGMPDAREKQEASSSQEPVFFDTRLEKEAPLSG